MIPKTIEETTYGGLPCTPCSRFFIARPGDIIPRTHMQAWGEWEVGDRQGMDRICLTSSKRKAELIRDALESSHAKDEAIRVSSVCRELKLENDMYRNAIEQAIVELCPRARPSQARRILRIGLGQDPNQIYNSEPDSSESVKSAATGSGRNDHE